MKNLKEYASLVNARLEELLPKLPEGSCEKGEGMPWLLADAMRYSLLAGVSGFAPACCWRRWICWGAISTKRWISPAAWK